MLFDTTFIERIQVGTETSLSLKLNPLSQGQHGLEG